MNAIELILRHLRYATRSLSRRPVLAIVALTTLALGIGANTAIFSVINVVLLEPLPFHDPDRLVMVWSTAPNQGLAEGFSSYPDFHDWSEQARGFSGLAAFWTFPNGDVNLTGGSEPQRVSVARITPGFFDVLGVPPLHGRTFQPEESIVGNHRRAILSYGLWHDHFGADSTLVGRSVMVNGFPYTVVGIMPPELTARSVHLLGTDVQLWRPLVPEDNQTGGRDSRMLHVVGRLAPGVTLQQAEADLSAVATSLARIYPESNRETGVRLIPLHEQVVRDVRRGLVLLLAAVGVVLLGACANVANLLLIKAAATRKQVAIQYALGASRLRLSAQVLVEALLLGGAGALFGVLLAYCGVKAFVAIGPADIPLLADARIERLLHVDPGFHSERVLTFQLELPMGTGMPYASQPTRSAFFQTLLERIAALPDARATTLASAPPLDEEPSSFSFTLPGAADGRVLRANRRMVAPDYFALLGIPLVRGRPFEQGDRASGPRVVIVSEALARSTWGSRDPVGQQIATTAGNHAEVIGVVGNVRTGGLDAEVARTVYVPTTQGAYNFMTVLVKTRNDPASLVPAIRTIVRELDASLPLHHVRTAEAMVAGSVARQRFQMLLVGTFSLLMFGLAVVGTYGVTAYGVSERMSEFGIRTALGATGGDIRKLVLGEGARLVLVGIVIGGLATVAMNHTLIRFVFGISTLDLVTFVASPAVLAAAALLATFIPAHRAARADPMWALRSE